MSSQNICIKQQSVIVVQSDDGSVVRMKILVDKTFQNKFAPIC